MLLLLKLLQRSMPITLFEECNIFQVINYLARIAVQSSLIVCVSHSNLRGRLRYFITVKPRRELDMTKINCQHVRLDIHPLGNILWRLLYVLLNLLKIIHCSIFTYNDHTCIGHILKFSWVFLISLVQCTQINPQARCRFMLTVQVSFILQCRHLE